MATPVSVDKFYSDVLPPDRVQQGLKALPDVFRSLLGDSIVTAYYGFGTEIHGDLQYVPMRVGTLWIDRFINDSIERGIVVPGSCDFSFTSPDDRLEVLFCHEGDIHPVLVGCRIHEDEYVDFLLATGFHEREFSIRFNDCSFIESKVIGTSSNECLLDWNIEEGGATSEFKHELIFSGGSRLTVIGAGAVEPWSYQ